jgi:hypothetical protein
MPAVFQIVSRDSGKALGLSQPLPVSADTTVGIEQFTQNDQDPTQMWVLTPRDPEDFLIQPFTSSDFAIGLDTSGEETDLPGALLQLTPVSGAQAWRISRRLANPPYFFFLEASNDLLLGVSSEGGDLQIFTRTEHPNQQWTFLPVFAQLGNDG